MTKDMIKQANDILLRNGDSQIPNSDEEHWYGSCYWVLEWEYSHSKTLYTIFNN